MSTNENENKVMVELDKKFLSQNNENFLLASSNYSNRIEDDINALTKEELNDYNEQIALLKERLELAKGFLDNKNMTMDERKYFYEELKSIQLEIQNIYALKNESIQNEKKQKRKSNLIASIERMVPTTLNSLSGLGVVIKSIIDSYNATLPETVKKLEIKESLIKGKTKLVEKVRKNEN